MCITQAMLIVKWINYFVMGKDMQPNNLPHRKAPCANCPFRKDSREGWLGSDRMREITEATSFVCHKNTRLQCAGHMILMKSRNDYYKYADYLGMDLNLTGQDLIFKNVAECIEHHGK